MAACAHGPAAEHGGDVRATAAVLGAVDGAPFTSDELGGELQQRLQAVADDCAVRRFALTWGGSEDIIARRVLAAEAARQGIPTDALLQQEVLRKVGDPSDDELQGLYQAHREAIGAPLAEVVDALRQQWHDDRVLQLRRALTDRLRGGHQVRIDLPVPQLARHLVGPGPLEPRGPREAPVEVVVFADYACGFSAQARRLMTRLRQLYPEAVRWVHRDLPQDGEGHRHPSAEAAFCANEQHKFWPMFDLLFEGAGRAGPPEPARAAQALGLDMAQFRDCLASPRPGMTLLQNQRDAARLGIESTPALFVNGMHIAGALPLDAMRAIVEAEIGRGHR